ncbi:TlpA family protein disulfide reductase [Sphingobacterium paucimobilis]|uniref:Thioredoxin domain-containing protein n=1 Tax=Sphingobacterium paucimobilis HER1398 TaxID=1346330 RepID=U2J245_9SPHI|nr:thioredoxin family protein [Sphingobacterium paucimobilis]ERJ59024.1 hypothetical protein M472_09600 [Sphingobacterium paucimobilis HER1398]
MKTLVYNLTVSILLVLLAMGASYAQSFQIDGQVEGVKDGTIVHLLCVEHGGKDSLARGVFKKGKFKLKGRVSSPRLCEIQIEQTVQNSDGTNYKSSRNAKLMLDNVKMSFFANHLDSIPSFMERVSKEKNVIIKGGDVQQEYQEYRDYMYAAELTAYNAWRDLYWSPLAEKRNQDTQRKAEEVKNQADEDVEARQRMFVKLHPTYAISALLASEWIKEPFTYSGDELDSLYHSLSQGRDQVRIAQIKNEIVSAKRYTRNSKYRDFGLLTVNKDTSSLKEQLHPQKYSLIDFWASWCGPCRAAIPDVRRLYNSKGDRLHIIAISVDAKENDWRKAMNDEKMEWTQLWIPKELMKAVQDGYQLKSIPFLLLLTPDGNIAYAGHDVHKIESILEEQTY